jgi:uncharacterized protein with beta-barrel porin domain
MASVATRAFAFVPTALAVGVSLAGPAQAGTVNPVQTTTYNLSPANNPITFGAGTNINVSGSDAVDGDATTQWNVTNDGRLTGQSGIVLQSSSTVLSGGSITGTTFDGVFLATGGSLDNQAGGVIIGAKEGVYAKGASANVTNAGTITGTSHNGVGLFAGGSIANQSGGKISGGNYGVYIEGGDGSVTNAGAISGVVTGVGLNATNASVDNSGSIASTGKYGFGVNLKAGGSVTNETGGYIGANRSGVAITGGVGSVTNSGVIQSAARDGVFLGSAGGTVTNNAGGQITGANYGVVEIGGGTVTNAGAISATTKTPGYGVSVAVAGPSTIANLTGGSISGPTTGVYGSGGPVTLTNAGSIAGGNRGVDLEAGGTVTNAAGGVIQGGATGEYQTGVYIAGATGSVTNSGAISGGSGVALRGGGTLTNSGNVSGTASYGFATVVTGGAGSVTNSGNISGASFGVVLTGGGSVTNQAGGAITSHRDGVVIEGASGNITNAGTITDSSTAITGVAAILMNGGTITNEAGGVLTGATGAYGKAAFTLTNAGTITGKVNPGVSMFAGGTMNNQAGGVITGASTGVYARGGSTSVTNAGTISGTSWNGVGLFGGGSVANAAGGRISGGNYGVYITGGDGSVTNAGSITGVSTGVGLAATNASVDNSGSIVSTGKYGFGVYLKGHGGSVTNEAGSYIASTASTGRTGVAITGGAGTVTNSGVILSASRDGVFLGSGGQVTNNAGASITGANYGVVGFNGVTVTNAGTIKSTATGSGYGVALVAGGTVTNQAGGSITGAIAGVYVEGGGSVTNAGAIGGADSVLFAGAGANTLTLQTGSRLTGDAVGSAAAGATNALVLQGAGEADNNFLNFGSLVAQGPGTWTLGGSSAIATTEVAEGTLAVTGALTSAFTIDKGATLQGGVANLLAQGAVVDNGALVLDQPTDATFANDISGTGALVKANVGALTLGGTANVGSTEVAGGSLIVTGVLTSAIQIDKGATLQGSLSTIQAQGTITDNGTFVLDQPTDGTLANNVVGSGALTLNEGGVLTMSGASQLGSVDLTSGKLVVTGSLASAITVASGATLQSGNRNLAGSIVDNGAVVFADANAGTYAGAISGTGSLAQQGPGTLTLSGASNVATTEVAGGVLNVTGSLASVFTIDPGATLQGGGGALQGNVADNGTLIFAQTGAGTFNGNVTGLGALVKLGSGLTVLDGVSSVASTTINAGNLQIGDAGHPGAKLTSPVAVNAGGTLSGHGTVVGNVTNSGGVVSPGGSIGTLTIQGDYTQSSTGTLAIELTPNASSQLKVTGTAHLAGTLLFEPDAGVYRKGQVYDFLSANAVTGSFSTITFQGPALFTVNQQGNTFTATANVGNFALQGGTANQRSIVTAFNNFPAGVSDFDPVANAIFGLNAGAGQNLAINELGSEASPDLIGASRGSVRNLLGGLTDQLGARPASSGDANDPVWVQATGRFGSTSSDGDAHGFSDTTAGIAGGVQRDFGAATLGGAVSYDQTWLTLSGLPQNGNVADTSLGLYGEERMGTLYADLAGVVGFDHGTEKRFIVLPGVDRQASGSFNGLSSGVLGQVGDRLAMSGGWTLEPRAGLAWSHVDQNGFTEKGAGGADLAIAGESQDAVQSLLGARVTKVLGGSLTGEASLDWAHDFNDLTPRAAESFAAAPGTGFAIDGVNPGRDAALFRAGLSYHASRITFYARYDGSFSNRADDNQVTGGLRIAF